MYECEREREKMNTPFIYFIESLLHDRWQRPSSRCTYQPIYTNGVYFCYCLFFSFSSVFYVCTVLVSLYWIFQRKCSRWTRRDTNWKNEKRREQIVRIMKNESKNWTKKILWYKARMDLMCSFYVQTHLHDPKPEHQLKNSHIHPERYTPWKSLRGQKCVWIDVECCSSTLCICANVHVSEWMRVCVCEFESVQFSKESREKRAQEPGDNLHTIINIHPFWKLSLIFSHKLSLSRRVRRCANHRTLNLTFGRLPFRNEWTTEKEIFFFFISDNSFSCHFRKICMIFKKNSFPKNGRNKNKNFFFRSNE